MCRYLPASAVNRPVGLGVYTKAMMIKRILTICAAIAAGMAGTSLAHAQQGYPAPGQVYSTAPGPYVPGGYATGERRGPGRDGNARHDGHRPAAVHEGWGRAIGSKKRQRDIGWRTGYTTASVVPF